MARGKTSKDHPKFLPMVLAAISELKGTHGASIPAIVKYIRANYDVGKLTERSLRTWVRITVRRGVSTGALTSARGHSQSFKATDRGRAVLKRQKKKAPKPAAAAAPKKKKAPKAAAAKKPKAPKAPRKKKAVAAPAAAAAALLPGIETPMDAVPAVAVAEGMPTTTGVAFCTTDIPEVRADVVSIIKNLLQDDDNAIGIIANRGAGDPATGEGAYKLELLPFTSERAKIESFIEGAFGEGSNWLEYYTAVMNSALGLPWASCRKRYLFLVGAEGTSVLTDASIQALAGRLESQHGVRVFGFHHTQLDILQAILADLH